MEIEIMMVVILDIVERESYTEGISASWINEDFSENPQSKVLSEIFSGRWISYKLLHLLYKGLGSLFVVLLLLR